MSMFSDAIDALLAGSCANDLESETFECKQEGAGIKETLNLMADVVVCLANAHGGTLLVGVHDKHGGPGAIIGVSEMLSVDSVIKGVFDRTKPALSVPVYEHHVQGKRLLEILVPRGAIFYSNAKRNRNASGWHSM